MQETTRGRVARTLLSNKRHIRYLQILAIICVFVAVGVALYLRQHGFAMVHEVTVLDCPYDGNGAHTHDASCYDDEGELVCPLDERELHFHDDSCYTEETTLICGQEESEGHTHGEECYDEEGNLTCEQEESEGHQHTDECYETTRTLTCGKEEVTEEHVHGPGCFKTILVDDGVEEEVSTAPVVSGEQIITYDLKEYNDNDDEVITVSAAVKAPAGTLPMGASVQLERLDATRADEAQRMAEDLVSYKLGSGYTVTRASVVRLRLLDEAGEKAWPAGNVQVKLWADFVRDADRVVLVRVPDPDNPDLYNAELVDGAILVNWNDSDSSVGYEDTLRFWSDLAVDSLVIAEVESPYQADEPEPIVTEQATTDEQTEEQDNKQPDPSRVVETTMEFAPSTDEGTGFVTNEPSYPAQRFVGRAGNVSVSVIAPEGAFPAGTRMRVEAIDTADVKDAVSSAAGSMVDAVAAVDITFYDPDGVEVQPLVPIEVTMTNTEGTAQDGQPLVVHVDHEGEASVVSQTGVTTSTDEVTFDSDAFSVYVMARASTSLTTV